jgi:hypothetical protein
MSIVRGRRDRGRRDRIRFGKEPRCHWCGELITYKRDPRTEEDEDGNRILDWDGRARWTTDHRCTRRPPMIRSSVGTGLGQGERIAERVRLMRDQTSDR